MTALVLDAEALSLLADAGAGSAEVMAAVKAAANLGRPVVAPTVVLAELLRGSSRMAAVNSALNRSQDLVALRNTDREFAGLVGGVLHAAGAGSADMVDAHCVAATVEYGGGVILTADTDDMIRLSAPYRNVIVERV